MLRITIDLGDFSLDDVLERKTLNIGLELEIVRIIKLLKEQEIFEVKLIELNGNSVRILESEKMEEK